MKILILGHGKSGTTVFLFKVAGGLPNCQAFSGGDPGRHLGDYENAVYKHTYNERKGRTLIVTWIIRLRQITIARFGWAEILEI
jgi:hypothetical protein